MRNSKNGSNDFFCKSIMPGNLFTSSGNEFSPLRISLKIAGIYFILGCLWILLSDKIASVLVSDKELLVLISMIKGWIYVLISASLIFFLVLHSLSRVKRIEKKLYESYDELTAAHEKLESTYEEISDSEEELRLQYDQLIENQQQLLESEERYRLITEAANDAIWEEKNEELFLSDRWFEIMGYSRNELKEISDWNLLIHPEDKECVLKKMEEHNNMKTPIYSCEYRLRKKDGNYIWIQARGKALFDNSGRVIRMAGSHTDITDLKNSQEQLHFLAYHDSLTGLPNKLSIYEDSKEIFSTPGNKVALMFIDMDNFKYINDTMGHAFGDQFIIKVSERLRCLFKEKCSIYRLGGDEFAIIVQDIENQEDAEIFASNILAGFKDRIEINDSILNTGISIGIVIYPDHGNNFNDLLKRADIAMYKAKELGKNRYVVYDQHMNVTFFERMDIEKYLRSALDRNEFDIYYQPQFDLKQNKVTGFEALLRWKSPELGNISPSKFIKIAEDSHLIVPLGTWVLRSACAFLKKLHLKGYKNINVSVNISILQLLQSDFVDMVKDTLDSLQIEQKYLELEITESILVESIDTINDKLESLKEMGIRIALDDFGKGYSSLSYLKHLPIKTLKIDKSFIDDIPANNVNRNLTGHIVTIGKSMGMCIIAEGVEYQEQLEYLVQHGCDKIQGYLFSKPVPEHDIERLLEG